MSISENQKDFFKQIIEQLEEDKKLAQKNLNRNLDKISEININLKSLMDKELEEDEVFSPRSIRNLYGQQIEVYNEEKNILEERNKDNYEAINRLNILLNKI